MRITVLTVPGCPNAPLAMERVAAALAARRAEVELVEVHDQAQAAEYGMNGSPTILLDGVDPFAPQGVVPSVSCRLYRHADGTVSGAPSVAALREALDCGAVQADPSAPDDCCEAGDPLDAVGRGGRGRRAPDGRGLRAVQQAVLRHFAAAGTAPRPAELEPAAAQAGSTAGEVLAELAREDFDQAQAGRTGAQTFGSQLT
ncbi:thioredoxin family protein [Streptomyces sp. NBC_00158]|uniref:thioredoxin family protein n=1 Tax=Streptomyces sp. NBC_00158 TaxID=2903627 RepID=UPI003245B3E4